MLWLAALISPRPTVEAGWKVYRRRCAELPHIAAGRAFGRSGDDAAVHGAASPCAGATGLLGRLPLDTADRNPAMADTARMATASTR